jgi:hypothetical protein
LSIVHGDDVEIDLKRKIKDKRIQNAKIKQDLIS